MSRSLWLSAAIHGILLLVLFAGTFRSTGVDPIAETVTIRIRNVSGNAGSSETARAGSPAESVRETRRSARIPAAESSSHVLGSGAQIPSSSFPRPALVQGLSTPNTTELPSVRITGVLDPLAGLEEALPESPGSRISGSNPWSLSWANGGKRGILSFPMIDLKAFPEDTERLLNVQILLRVSPEGEVVSAEIVPPGSGDIRIDRYMHSVALQLFLEPWPDGEGVQEGRLRLLFVGGTR